MLEKKDRITEDENYYKHLYVSRFVLLLKEMYNLVVLIQVHLVISKMNLFLIYCNIAKN
jgi:hypothetical protein